jgi:hypothetical protein
VWIEATTQLCGFPWFARASFRIIHLTIIANIFSIFFSPSVCQFKQPNPGIYNNNPPIFPPQSPLSSEILPIPPIRIARNLKRILCDFSFFSSDSLESASFLRIARNSKLCNFKAQSLSKIPSSSPFRILIPAQPEPLVCSNLPTLSSFRVQLGIEYCWKRRKKEKPRGGGKRMLYLKQPVGDIGF